MAKCFYCSRQIEPGRGIMVISVAGNILNFCSSKCRKNWKMGRESINLKWITKKKK